MAAISLKCLLKGSRSSHQPPRICRRSNIPPGRAMLLIGRIFGCFYKKKWETWKRTLFSKLFQKMFICLYFWTYHSFLRIYFCKTYFGNELHSKFLLQYFLTKFFFVHDCKLFLPSWLGNLCWSLQHWRKGEVHMDLMPPGTPKVYVFFLFCIIWAASVRRLKSLPKTDIMLLTMKNVTQDVIFAW